ncbi:MAG: hypothetical protein JRJ42_11720 [Deltaproteobacteria bacterium]|nr:hypothetical protein [Deltaproteobacteria bacterium]RLB81605.1 MAG: hypothetical protein DRH17_08680 [Deltaproteobacteria bacterium]
MTLNSYAELGRKYPLLLYMQREMSAFLSRFPVLFMPMVRLFLILQKQKFKMPHILVSNDTELVIEGYPRSANTFAVVAFELAQGRPVSIAHHLHLPLNVVLAAKRNLPCLVLIRDPDEAVLSLTVGFLKTGIRQALREYVRFYKRIKPYREHYVVASFEEVTQDFGLVIRKMNRKFGTNYREFEHTPENVKKCFERIELITFWQDRLPRVNEVTVPRPSLYRQALKDKIERGLQSPALEGLRKPAYYLYQDFLSYTNHP